MSNAWERAQQAITRAAERDSRVITPDTAESPFDASSTTVIPHAQAAGRAGPVDPDVTQRLPQRPNGASGGNGQVNGHAPGGRHAAPAAHDAESGLEARTERMNPRPTVRTSHPGTSPFPALKAPAHDETPTAEEPEKPWWRRLFGR